MTNKKINSPLYENIVQRYRKQIDAIETLYPDGFLNEFFRNAYEILKPKNGKLEEPFSLKELLVLNNYIVNAVTGLEVYFKDIILVNKDWNENGYIALLQDKISLAEAYNLFTHQLVTREYLVVHFNKLQNFEKIEYVFTNLIGEDFYQSVENHEISFLGIASTITTLKNEFPDWKKQIIRLYDIRNQFVHEGILEKLAPNEFLTLTDTLLYYALCMDNYFNTKYKLLKSV